MPFHTNQLGLEKRHWNLETSSAGVEFLPPYLVKIEDNSSNLALAPSSMHTTTLAKIIIIIINV